MNDKIRDIARPEDDDPPALREAKEKLGRLVEARVSDDGLKSMIPLFVRGGQANEDHKCGGCSMRIGTGSCSVVFGTVSFPHGVCLFWARGDKPATHDHDAKMTKAEAGYVEVAPGVAVNCSSCARYYRGESFCRLWEGDVEPEDCCVSYKPASRVMAEAPNESMGGEAKLVGGAIVSALKERARVTGGLHARALQRSGHTATPEVMAAEARADETQKCIEVARGVLAKE